MRKCRLTYVHQPCNIPDYFLVRTLFPKLVQILQTLRDDGAPALTAGLPGFNIAISHLQTKRTSSRSATYRIGNVMLSIESL